MICLSSGERPFRCEEEGCGKSFTRNEELTRHKRIHSGLRPYPCDSCGKTFGRKDHLKKHARTHLPQPSYIIPPHLYVYPYLYGYWGHTSYEGSSRAIRIDRLTVHLMVRIYKSLQIPRHISSHNGSWSLIGIGTAKKQHQKHLITTIRPPLPLSMPKVLSIR